MASDGSRAAFPSGPPSPTSVRSGGTTVAASDAFLLPQHGAGNTTPQTPSGPSTYEQIREGHQGDGMEGWPLLAKLMTEKPDFEAFDRFEELNVKNLLYYQVELACIKRRLEKREREDQARPHNDVRSQFHTIAVKLIDSKTNQWDDVEKLRTCLKAYNEALLQYHQISNLPEPSSRNMNALIHWLVSPEAGNFKVSGIGNGAWGDQYARVRAERREPRLAKKFISLLLSIVKSRSETPTRPNLVAPRGRRSVDGLTRWIAEEAIPFWAALKEAYKKRREKKITGGGPGGGEEGESVEGSAEFQERATADSEKEKAAKELKDLKLEYIQSYSGHSILKLTNMLTTLFACMLPMVAIGVLSRINDLSLRLGLIALFTSIFCLGLMMVAEVTRVQVFTATSAFLAVLVVFVQSQ